MNASCLITFRYRRYTSHRLLCLRKQIRSPLLKTYSLNVKLFHLDSVQALDEADRLADAIREARNMVPLLSESGEKTGDKIRISRIETRVGDRGEAVMVIRWSSRYYYHKTKQPVLQDIDMNSGVK